MFDIYIAAAFFLLLSIFGFFHGGMIICIGEAIRAHTSRKIAAFITLIGLALFGAMFNLVMAATGTTSSVVMNSIIAVALLVCLGYAVFNFRRLYGKKKTVRG